MDAIWASKPSIGRPAPARWTITGPNQASRHEIVAVGL
jgi:hypothetical protein